MKDSKIQHLNINYELNRSNYSAQIVFSPIISGDIIIPKSIKVGSEEYFVTTIKK